MIYPPVAELVKKTKTRYSLAILTARRARQLGAESGGEYDGKFDEAILKAIDEIDEGKVSSRPKNYYFDHVISADELIEDDASDEQSDDNTPDVDEK